MINNEQIDYRFKILYVIGIMSVIVEHLHGYSSIEFDFQGWLRYSSYHMPLFMFGAGYFFKQKNLKYVTKYIYNKFKKLVLPIYIYNLFYGFYSQLLKKLKFKNMRDFSFDIIFLKPLIGTGFKNIAPSWFSATLFYVEVYNILKRKLILSLFKFDFNELLYFIIDFIISLFAVYYSNLGYNKTLIYIAVLRTMHLNIYYQLGIFYKKILEQYFKNLKNDFFIIIIFTSKFLIHLYHGKELAFYYGASDYYNCSPLSVFIISFLGIMFWMRFCEIFESVLGKNYYINIIADNTYSMMINNVLANNMITTIYFFISKYTNYCQSFNKEKYFNYDHKYIYIPNNKVRQLGIIYVLNGLIFPIILQKIINKIKKYILDKIKQLKK